MMKRFLLQTFLLLVATALWAQQQTPAFPTAEGYGMYARGGRGGQVVAVTNTTDYLSTETPIVGSLRWAFTQYPDQPLTVVFRTSGTIVLKSDLRVKRNYLTVAGQTAPGDGIFIRGAKVNFGGSTHFILRHLRFRVGLTDANTYIDGGSIGLENASNCIIDHCTFGWSCEENMTMYDNTFTTVQWSIIHEGLYDAGHPKGVRGYGTQWGGQTATYHHNLLAHNYNRSPRFNGARSNDARVLMDFVNNVNYNWGKSNSAYGADIEGGTVMVPRWHKVNFINNYYKPGPARPGTSSSFFVQSSFSSAQRTDQIALWYMTGNVMEGSANVDKTNDNYLGIDASAYASRGIPASALRSDTMFTTPNPVKTETAIEAYESVLAKAGAFPRDTVDRRIVNEVRTGTALAKGKQGSWGIIDSPHDVGGYPEYNTFNTITDADADGMDDAWETANGLDPENPADRNLVTLSGYTALEVYLNSLFGEHIDLVFASATPATPEASISAYPTLAGNEIFITSDAPLKSAKVFSLSGIIVLETMLNGSSSIEISKLNPGSYFIRVETKDGYTGNFRFIKK